MTPPTSAPDPRRWWALVLSSAVIWAAPIAFRATALAALSIRMPRTAASKTLAVMLVLGLLAACKKGTSHEGHTGHTEPAAAPQSDAGADAHPDHPGPASSEPAPLLSSQPRAGTEPPAAPAASIQTPTAPVAKKKPKRVIPARAPATGSASAVENHQQHAVDPGSAGSAAHHHH